MKKVFVIFFMIIILFSSFTAAKKLTVLEELTNPAMMEIDGNELFVLDDVEVHVYSLQDNRFLRKFGKKGEGPGELLPQPDVPVIMKIYSDYILLYVTNKMIYYSKTGEVIKEKRIPFVTFQILSFGKNYAATKFTRSNQGGSQVTVMILNDEFKELKKLYETELLNDFRKGKIAFPFMDIFLQCTTDQLFIVDQKSELEVLRFDLDGNQLTPIKHSYQRIKVTEEYKKRSWDWLIMQPAFKTAPDEVKRMLYFLEYLPVIRYFHISDNKIYIQTYKTKKALSQFFIMDQKGSILKTVFLPGADKERLRPTPALTYAFKDNKYYYLVDKPDEEEWELHVVDY
jgi:hypothetical protein